MIKPIIKDTFLLSRKSTLATVLDLHTADDLADTLKAHKAECVGMAANMIGVSKCIIVVMVGDVIITMFNPKITRTVKPYDTNEGCLSLSGTRPVKRYETIDAEFYDRNFKKQKSTFSGFTAQIIQHEIDHCNGIII